MSQKLKEITHTFLTAKKSTTIIIPIHIARKYKIDQPTNVMVEEAEDGILIKPLHLDGE